MNNQIYNGVITALITPLYNGKIDVISLHNLLQKQIDAKIKGVVIGGSTGEGTSLSLDQYIELIEISTNYVGNKINIIAGLNAVSTNEALNKIQLITKFNISGITSTWIAYIWFIQVGQLV